MAFTHVWHQRVIEDFAQSLANNRPPMVTGAEALQVHAVIDAMQTANRTGQKTEVQNP
jgi:predicted dehydrogenase